MMATRVTGHIHTNSGWWLGIIHNKTRNHKNISKRQYILQVRYQILNIWGHFLGHFSWNLPINFYMQNVLPFAYIFPSCFIITEAETKWSPFCRCVFETHLLCRPYWGCATPQGLLFGPRFLSQGCIFSKNSLAKVIFLTKKNGKIGILVLNCCLFLKNVFSQQNIWAKIPYNHVRMGSWSGNSRQPRVCFQPNFP